jgi:group I intron endonuclease
MVYRLQGRIVVMADRRTGVYAIRNTVNGKVYVGSAARCFGHRWSAHRTSLRAGKHCNVHLQRAWNKYGEAAFEFVVLVECHPDECLKHEQIEIDLHKATDLAFGYNIAPTAGSSRGVKHSAATRAKVSAALKRRETKPETRAKRSLTLLGHSVSEDARRKIAAATRGKQLSDEHKAKVGAASRKIWETRDRTVSAETRAKMRLIALARPPMSAETRAKVAAASRGRKHSDEIRAKIAAANAGHAVSPATRARIGAANSGRVHSAEHKAKNAAAQRKRYESPEERARTAEATSKGQFARWERWRAARGEPKSLVLVRDERHARSLSTVPGPGVEPGGPWV